MTLRFRLRFTLVLTFLLGVPFAAQAQAAIVQPEAGDTLLHFGSPTRWPVSMSPQELLIQAPPPAGKVPGTAVAPGASEAGSSYSVFALEFKDVAARKQFETFKWPTVSAFDRFLEVFVEAGERPRFKDQTQAFKGLVWVDDLKARVTPPRPLRNRAKPGVCHGGPSRSSGAATGDSPARE